MRPANECLPGVSLVTLIRLTYFSRNLLDRFNAPMNERVAEIVAASMTNNRRLDITSALIYDNKWFAQSLEGHERAVSSTFERILRDPRHADVSLVAMGPIVERRLDGCPMVGIGQEPENADLFRHYAESARFDPRQMQTERLADLIEALASRFRREGGTWPSNNAAHEALRLSADRP